MSATEWKVKYGKIKKLIQRKIERSERPDYIQANARIRDCVMRTYIKSMFDNTSFQFLPSYIEMPSP